MSSAGTSHAEQFSRPSAAVCARCPCCLLRRCVTPPQDLPLGKVKGLGGKLGHKLESLGATTAGAAAGLSWEVLVDAFGGKAR